MQARTLLGLDVSKCRTRVVSDTNTYNYVVLCDFLKLLAVSKCQCPCRVRISATYATHPKQVPAKWNNILLNFTSPKGPLHLNSSNRMNNMCPPNCSGLASDNPMYFIFPSCTNFLSSPIYDSKKIEYCKQINDIATIQGSK
jgi:hypothetical protein